MKEENFLGRKDQTVDSAYRSSFGAARNSNNFFERSVERTQRAKDKDEYRSLIVNAMQKSIDNNENLFINKGRSTGKKYAYEEMTRRQRQKLKRTSESEPIHERRVLNIAVEKEQPQLEQ